MPRSAARLLPFVLVPALALAATSAPATTVRTGKAAASAPTPRVYASRDQLRDCMDTEDGLKARQVALQAAQAEHDASMNAFDAEGAKIDEAQGRLDHESEVAVQAFNGMVNEHNAAARQLNQQGAQDRATAAAFNADSLAFTQKCAPLVYRVDDMDAVLKERRAAGKRAGP